MSYQRSFRTGGNSNNPFGSIISLLIFVGILIFLFFVVTSFVKLLYLVAPVLLIATLLINHRIVADYVMGVFDTFRNDILFGIVKILFSVFCYPFVIGWLFAKAMFYRKVNTLKKDMEQQMGHTNQTQDDTQYTEYEELSSDLDINKKPEKPIILDLPKPKDKTRDDFDQLFK
jgi:uncharacterized membrane protein YciS (DUF1049 family)